MPTSGVRSACKHKKPSSAQSNTPIPMKVNMPTPGIPSGSHNNTPSSSQNDTAKPVNVNPPTPSHQATQTGITHPTPTSSNIRQPILNIKILGFLLSISSSKIDAEAYPVLQALQAITKDYDVTPPTSALPPNELPKHKRSTSIEKFCKYREIFDILIKHYQKQLYEFETKGDNGSLHTLMMMEGNAGFFSDDDRKFGQTWDKAMDVVYWDHASLVEKVIERGNLFDEWEDMERQRDRMAEGLVIVLRELQRAFQSVNV
ncbi:hypothetical protein BZA77DRAFT_356827 [Pyronema omphalodes]|nr:hypothetical protein BZA77DRAFT_357656 [Pyronema omphalodes]KAI5814309.1 hypothetical protein BZA77DRAFT_356827 [Pyronema omphalodes]